jgi:hypothetical protein
MAQEEIPEEDPEPNMENLITEEQEALEEQDQVPEFEITQ